MNRLIICVGTWQLLIVASALKSISINNTLNKNSDILVFRGFFVKDEQRSEINDIALTLWNWDLIIWFEDFNPKDYRIKNRSDLTELKKVLRGKLNDINFSEIWTTQILNLKNKVFFETYPDSNIVIYEDGIGAYRNYNTKIFFKLITKNKYLKNILNYIYDISGYFNNYSHINNYQLNFKYLTRIERIYLLLNGKIPIPKYLGKIDSYQIDISHFYENIKTVCNTIDIDLNTFEETSKNLLFLPQYFHLYYQISWDEELKIYNSIIKDLLSKNYKIYWKEHPRNNKPFFPYLDIYLDQF